MMSYLHYNNMFLDLFLHHLFYDTRFLCLSISSSLDLFELLDLGNNYSNDHNHYCNFNKKDRILRIYRTLHILHNLDNHNLHILDIHILDIHIHR